MLCGLTIATVDVAECSIVKVISPGTSNMAQAKFVPGPVLWNQDPAIVNRQADKVCDSVCVFVST